MKARTLQECREKISEMIGEAVVEDDDARREGLLKMADQWIGVAGRRKHQSRAKKPCPPGCGS